MISIVAMVCCLILTCVCVWRVVHISRHGLVLVSQDGFVQ